MPLVLRPLHQMHHILRNVSRCSLRFFLSAINCASLLKALIVCMVQAASFVKCDLSLFL